MNNGHRKIMSWTEFAFNATKPAKLIPEFNSVGLDGQTRRWV